MAVNWTQEPAQETRPANPHNALAWTLWSLSLLVLAAWGLLLILGIRWGGRVHLLLIAFALLTLVHIFMGFRNVNYFVPIRLTGGWFTHWGRRQSPHTRRLSGTHAGHDTTAPLTAFDSGTMRDETNQPTATTADILPGNDPVSGPGQRHPEQLG